MERNSTQWNEEDLLALINLPAEESVSLEYKGASSLNNTDPNKNEISKDVSAFANSGGGVIVYGMKETNERTALALDPIDPASDKRYYKRYNFESKPMGKL